MARRAAPTRPDRPKAPRDWRASLWEVGVVVIGVLIALAADQTVDALGWRQKVRAAEAAMRSELRDDDAPQAYVRVASSHCYAEALDRIQTAVETGESRTDVRALTAAYAPPFRTWDSEAWKTAISSDTASHTGPDRMLAWSKPYRLMPAMGETNREENFHLIELRAGRRGDGALSQTEAERLLLAVEALRFANQAMTTGSRVLLTSTAEVGVTLSPVQKQAMLTGLRRRFGACVAEPAREADLSSDDPLLTRADERPRSGGP